MEKQWPDWANVVLGSWLFISPFALQLSYQDKAAWNAFVVGAVIAAVAAMAAMSFQMWEEWTNLILGIWLIIAPSALGFQSNAVTAWNQISVGALVIIFAGWQVYANRATESST